MALEYLMGRNRDEGALERRVEPRLGPEPAAPASEVFDTGRRTIIDCAHVRVERLDTQPVLYSKVFKEFEDRAGQKYDYRYWSERENFFLREFLQKQNQFAHVVQPRHLISENDAAKQVLTRDAGVTVANWLRVRARYADTATLSHPFQRSDAFLRLLRACLVALKEIHSQRIVHCDIKEDNICIPYLPHPFAGGRRPIHIEFGQLKLIDFAFSIAHAMPLSQILVIDPDERLPYQSARLIAALQEDRRSGCPNAVQHLDYGVDLFSLGHLAEKISAAGLDCPAGADEARALEDIRCLVQKLKAYDTEPASGPLPHDGMIAEIDRMLVARAGASASPGFSVEGEWSAEEMARSGSTVRQTPSTPVALPAPTAVAAPFAPFALRSRPAPVARTSLLIGLACAVVAGATVLYQVARDAGAPRAVPVLQKTAPTPDPAKSVAAELAATLTSAGPRAERAHAMDLLVGMARAGDSAAARHVAAFEKNYDSAKQSVARSAWWLRGEEPRPENAARWMEDGDLLAQYGDRPAMLDRAFALGHGRGVTQDRHASATTYLKVIDRSPAGNEASARIRQAAVRGLATLLNTIVEQKDQGAARSVLPVIHAKADAGAADLQYFSGLLSECALRPADLAAARRWYRRAAADAGWKRIAEQKARVLGRWCPGPSH